MRSESKNKAGQPPRYGRGIKTVTVSVRVPIQFKAEAQAKIKLIQEHYINLLKEQNAYGGNIQNAGD